MKILRQLTYCYHQIFNRHFICIQQYITNVYNLEKWFVSILLLSHRKLFITRKHLLKLVSI